MRLPREQAAALDRLVDATGQRKQQLVSDLLSDRLVVGRAELIEPGEMPLNSEAPPSGEVLTLAEAAALLRVPAEAVRARAERGELPGRRLGGEWRFARSALMAWLLEGEQSGVPS